MKKFAALFLVTLQVTLATQLHAMNRTPEEQRVVNQRIFAILHQNGAAEGMIYSFDQIFSSDSEKKIALVRNELLRLGYVAGSIDRLEKDGVTTYWIDAYKRMAYHREDLERDSMAMLALALKHGVFYDGWGAEVGEKEGSNQSSQTTPRGFAPRRVSAKKMR